MTIDNNHKNTGFYDSICTCKQCNHTMTRDCFKLNCNCCNNEDHSMVLDGFEGFERADKNDTEKLNNNQ
jgi:hypothetical protein